MSHENIKQESKEMDSILNMHKLPLLLHSILCDIVRDPCDPCYIGKTRNYDYSPRLLCAFSFSYNVFYSDIL